MKMQRFSKYIFVAFVTSMLLACSHVPVASLTGKFYAGSLKPKKQYIASSQEAHSRNLLEFAVTTDADCDAFFLQARSAVDSAATGNAQMVAVPSMPWLRTNRFWASFANEQLTITRTKFWLRQQANLAIHAWQSELLQAGYADEGDYASHVSPIVRQNIAFCVESKLKAYLNTYRLASRQTSGQADQYSQPAKTKAELQHQSITVPDNYSVWQRVVGLYPLTQLGVQMGADNWRRETKALLAKGLSGLDKARWFHYSLLNDSFDDGLYVGDLYFANVEPHADQVHFHHTPRTILATSSKNPLKVPLPNAEQQMQLFRHHAPQWWVEYQSSAEVLGSLTANGVSIAVSKSMQDAAPIAAIAAMAPVAPMYTAISHTRFNGRNLLQLNYFVWFTERPAEHWADIYAGKVDGLIWRVTLDEDGSVLLYDTIHSCGCYHLLFPSNKLIAKSDLQAEKPISHHLKTSSGSALPIKPQIFLQAGTHYVLAVKDSEFEDNELSHYRDKFFDHKPGKILRHRLVLQPYEGLAPLFDEDGLLPNTQRLERWLLWPTGVISPGQMRQMGTHATAFTGKRHFDDANILNALFTELSQ